jgi:tubulin-specific chaperone A
VPQTYLIDYLFISGDDDHTLRKQEEVIQESIMMVSDCQKRLSAAHCDLKAILDNEKDLSETEEYQNAFKALELAIPHF